MTSGCTDTRRTLVKPHGGAGSVTAAPPTVEQEQLPCPRCDSTNTKFCYYNNYNFSQPRHFCKSCRRYWTHGGTLRDIPIGGGSRKTAKRSRTCSSSSSDSNAVVSTSSSSRNVTFQANPVMFPSGGTSIGGSHVATVHDVKGSALSLCGSFTSLLNNNAGLTSHGPGGLIGLNGFGLGLGSGFDDVGFAIGRGVWPFSTVDDATAGVGNHGGPAAPLHATWHLDGIENNTRFISGDCLSWPDLAISTHGNTLK